MNLRTRDRRRQWAVWLDASCLCIALYAVSVRLFGGDDAAAFYEPEQMRFFLPFAILFGFIAYETRWDGVRRTAIVKRTEEGKDAEALDQLSNAGESSEEKRAVAKPPAVEPVLKKVPAAGEIKRVPPPAPPSVESNSDAAYDVLLQEAEAGSVPAMEGLCELAIKRGATVEAYFWAARAEKCGSASAPSKMFALRKKWLLAGCPAQRHNVHEGFSEERGSLARALLRMACGLNRALARQRIRKLAESGQPDAQLFV